MARSWLFSLLSCMIGAYIVNATPVTIKMQSGASNITELSKGIDPQKWNWDVLLHNMYLHYHGNRIEVITGRVGEEVEVGELLGADLRPEHRPQATEDFSFVYFLGKFPDDSNKPICFQVSSSRAGEPELEDIFVPTAAEWNDVRPIQLSAILSEHDAYAELGDVPTTWTEKEVRLLNDDTLPEGAPASPIWEYLYTASGGRTRIMTVHMNGDVDTVLSNANVTSA